ncbi:LysM peptidoglycan-binding domain-containing protein [Aerococcus suis]
MTAGRKKQSKHMREMAHKSLKMGSIILGSALSIAALDAYHHVETVSAKENTVHFAATSNPFLNQLIPHAYEIANDNDLYASVMMAQAILESGWGQSGLSLPPYNNLFGIKGNYNGQSAVFDTLEDDGTGNYYGIKDGFRVYPSFHESLEDYADILRHGISGAPYFYAGTWKSNTNSYQDATAWLTGRYATDTSYGTKLNQIIEANDLTKYDTPAGSGKHSNATLTGNHGSQSTGRQSYTVQPGDGLFTVANRLGITVNEARRLNGGSDFIYPGQQFTTAKKQASQKPATKPTPSTNKGNQSYTVQSGDGLYTVAHKLGISVSEARRLNGGSDFIYPGQQFTTAKKQASQKPATKPTPSTNKGNLSYTVQSGDGLYTVARKLGISVSEARRLNGGSDLIYPGQQFTTSRKQASQKPATKPTPSTNKGNLSYTVQSGDGLYTVARKLGISVSEVRRLNGGSDFIYPGQTITAAKAPQANTQAPATSTSNGRAYTVKPGDGLYTVARQLGISVSEARQLNGGSDFIYAGQTFTKGSSTQRRGQQTQAANNTQASTSGNVHVVQSGETIWRIAQANSLTVDQLMQMNGLSSQSLYVGQRLNVSGAKVNRTTESQTPIRNTQNTQLTASETTTNQGTYTVKANDNLYRIALNHGVSLASLKAANHLSGNNLLVGQTLVIPN